MLRIGQCHGERVTPDSKAAEDAARRIIEYGVLLDMGRSSGATWQAIDAILVARALLDQGDAREARAAVAAARAQGRREGLEEAAKVAEVRYRAWKMPHPDDSDLGEVCCDVTACEDIAKAIRALEPGAGTEKKHE